jgi:hypothetical protein
LVRGIVVNLGVIISDESGARGTGYDNVFSINKVVHELVANFPGFSPIASIKGWLTATGLLWIVFYTTTGFLQNFDRIEPCFRVKLINETGYENMNFHSII